MLTLPLRKHETKTQPSLPSLHTRFPTAAFLSLLRVLLPVGRVPPSSALLSCHSSWETFLPLGLSTESFKKRFLFLTSPLTFQHDQDVLIIYVHFIRVPAGKRLVTRLWPGEAVYCDGLDWKLAPVFKSW